MNKQTLNTIIILGIITLLLGTVLWGSNRRKGASTQEKAAEQEQIIDETEEENVDIFYWGVTCPHCHDIIDWMKENEVDEKLTIVKKEVYQNRGNSFELVQKAQSCGLDTNSIGVPFMYTADKRCLIGVPDITEYLETRLSQMTDTEEELEEVGELERWNEQ